MRREVLISSNRRKLAQRRARTRRRIRPEGDVSWSYSRVIIIRVSFSLFAIDQRHFLWQVGDKVANSGLLSFLLPLFGSKSGPAVPFSRVHCVERLETKFFDTGEGV